MEKEKWICYSVAINGSFCHLTAAVVSFGEAEAHYNERGRHKFIHAEPVRLITENYVKWVGTSSFNPRIRKRLEELGVISKTDNTQEEILAAARRFYPNAKMIEKDRQAIEARKAAKTTGEGPKPTVSETSNPLTRVLGMPGASGQSLWRNPLQ